MTNYALWSEDFTNAVWATNIATITPNNAVAPDGTTTADSLSFYDYAYIEQVHVPGGSLSNRTFTFSIWMKSSSSTPMLMRIEENFGYTTQALRGLTSSWARYEVTVAIGSGAGTDLKIRLYNNPDAGSGGIRVVDVWGAQLEEASSAGTYLPTTNTPNNGGCSSTLDGAVSYSATATAVFSAGSPYNEEPAGFTPLYDHDFTMTAASQLASTAILPSGGSGWYAFPQNGGDGNPNITYVNGGAGDPSYARMRYPAGLPAGESPGMIGFQLAADQREIFDVTEFTIEGSNYEMQTPVGDKLMGFYGGIRTTGASNEIYFVCFRPGSPDTQFVTGMKMSVSLQSFVSRNLDPNVNTDFWITPGVKHRWSVRMKLNSAVDVADGEIWGWGDGVLRLHYTDVKFMTTTDSSGNPVSWTRGFYERKYDPTYGGAGNNKTRDDFVRIHRMYGSGIAMDASPVQDAGVSFSATAAATFTGSVDGETSIIRQVDFNDGTKGGLGTWETATPGVSPSDLPKIDVIDDPTGSGRGKVARLRFRSLGLGDDNTSLVEPTANGAPGNEAALGIGDPGRFYEFDFYIPSEVQARMNAFADFQQKLFYFKQSEYYGGNWHYRGVVTILGTTLHHDITFEETPGDGDTHRTYGDTATISAGQWYTLKVYLQRESAVGATDGIFRYWLDDVLQFEKTNATWSATAWIGQTMPNSSPARTTSAPDLYMDNILIGQQMNSVASGDTGFDYYRYIDNLTISTESVSGGSTQDAGLTFAGTAAFATFNPDVIPAAGGGEITTGTTPRPFTINMNIPEPSDKYNRDNESAFRSEVSAVVSSLPSLLDGRYLRSTPFTDGFLFASFADADAAHGVTQGLTVFCTDGTPGDPLTGGGTGCLAYFSNNRWKGI